MENWLIKDYKIRCQNLQNKITQGKVNMQVLIKRADKIKKKEKCDDLTAWKTLKKQLERELAKKSGK